MPDVRNRGLSSTRCLQAIHHVAQMLQARVSGGPTLFEVAIPTAAGDPSLAISLGEKAPVMDQFVVLQVAVPGQGEGLIQIKPNNPVYYLTTKLGFFDGCVNTFATTLQATINAYQSGGRVPTFPAPGQAPR